MTDTSTAERTAREQRASRATTLWFGLVLVGFGLLMTLNQFDIAPAIGIGRIWPVAVIGAGAAKMYESWGTPSAGSGVGLIMTGVWFLFVNFRIFGLSYHNAWPLLIVGVGVSIMWRALLEERGGRNRREDVDGR